VPLLPAGPLGGQLQLDHFSDQVQQQHGHDRGGPVLRDDQQPVQGAHVQPRVQQHCMETLFSIGVLG